VAGAHLFVLGAARTIVFLVDHTSLEAAGQKRRPPCCRGGLESREETPKEGIRQIMPHRNNIFAAVPLQELSSS
jgi:hypothetical protein